MYVQHVLCMAMVICRWLIRPYIYPYPVKTDIIFIHCACILATLMNKDIDITGDYRRNRVIELTFNWTADASAGMTALGFRSLH